MTTNKNVLKSPNNRIDAETKVVRPAAGPETAIGDLLIIGTTIPPIIPAKIPEYSGAFEARAIPKHNGKAIRKTERPAAKSCLSQIIR